MFYLFLFSAFVGAVVASENQDCIYLDKDLDASFISPGAIGSHVRCFTASSSLKFVVPFFLLARVTV